MGLQARLNICSCALCVHYFHLCPANGEKCLVREAQRKCRLVTRNWICACQKSILKTCDELYTAGNLERREGKIGRKKNRMKRKEWEWRWVWTTAILRVFEETANDPLSEMESEGLVTVNNSQTEQPLQSQPAYHFLSFLIL